MLLLTRGGLLLARLGLALVLADLVIVEVGQQLRRAALLHDALEPAPRRLGALGRAPPLRLDVTHDVVDVNVVHRRGVFGVLFLELVGFGLLVHAASGCATTGGRCSIRAVYKRKAGRGAIPRRTLLRMGG